ncbi:hypothetical protein M0R45_035199 [Rubus argutus]|uniref:Uncharacterized protein n=1 Tax=Rubus argutus TaxID=59490 RepID=A0AAW1VSC2_RUBAR
MKPCRELSQSPLITCNHQFIVQSSNHSIPVDTAALQTTIDFQAITAGAAQMPLHASLSCTVTEKKESERRERPKIEGRKGNERIGIQPSLTQAPRRCCSPHEPVLISPPSNLASSPLVNPSAPPCAQPRRATSDLSHQALPLLANADETSRCCTVSS